MSRFFGYWNKETQKFEWARPEEPKKEESTAIIMDEIPPTEYMGNSRREMFTSASRLKARCKEDGFEITGGDHLDNVGRRDPEYGVKISSDEVREITEKAYYDLKYDRVPIDERTKEICRREERKYQEYKRRQGIR